MQSKSLCMYNYGKSNLRLHTYVAQCDSETQFWEMIRSKGEEIKDQNFTLGVYIARLF